ncbi:MAG: hypothetical protein WDZ80_06080 [Candidatus Paceibacterota bacterium]
MTIIKPKKNKSSMSLFVFLLFTVVIVGGLTYIHQYNSLADNKYDVEHLEEGIKQAELDNANLNNKYYELTDLSNLEPVAKDLQLVLDDSPSYLNVNQWVSDSSF